MNNFHISADFPVAAIKKKARIQIHFPVVFKKWAQFGWNESLCYILILPQIERQIEEGFFLIQEEEKHVRRKEGWGNFWLPCQKCWDNQGDNVLLTEEESVMADLGKFEV